MAHKARGRHRESLMEPVFPQLGLVTQGDERAFAVTSQDDQYRYLLGRTWSTTPWWVFGMLNPSTARHDSNDPTIRKCIGFAQRGGAGGILVVNLLAYSTPFPDELVKAYQAGLNVVGIHNSEVLVWALGHPRRDRIIAAWGSIPPRVLDVAQGPVVQFLESKPDCLGTNNDGSPKHPSRIGYATPLVSYRPRRPSR